MSNRARWVSGPTSASHPIFPRCVVGFVHTSGFSGAHRARQSRCHAGGHRWRGGIHGRATGQPEEDVDGGSEVEPHEFHEGGCRRGPTVCPTTRRVSGWMRWIWSVMKNVPKCLFGPFRNAMRAAAGVQLERELFRLLPRGGLISKSFAPRELGFSLIRASEQFDELSLSRFINEREQGGHRQVQGLARPSCCPNAHPSVPCRVATSRVLCIFRCTPAGVAANSTSLATTKHRARRVGAKGLVIIGTVDSSEHSSDS